MGHLCQFAHSLGEVVHPALSSLWALAQLRVLQMQHQNIKPVKFPLQQVAVNNRTTTTVSIVPLQWQRKWSIKCHQPTSSRTELAASFNLETPDSDLERRLLSQGLRGPAAAVR